MLSQVIEKVDNSAGLKRLRILAHRTGSLIAFWVDCGCVAAVSLTFITFSLAGFDLVRAARLWGGFWTHFADAAPTSRAPVTATLIALWAATTLLTALCRAPGQRLRRKHHD